jgi:hypothetical protein
LTFLAGAMAAIFGARRQPTPRITIPPLKESLYRGYAERFCEVAREVAPSVTWSWEYDEEACDHRCVVIGALYHTDHGTLGTRRRLSYEAAYHSPGAAASSIATELRVKAREAR